MVYKPDLPDDIRDKINREIKQLAHGDANLEMKAQTIAIQFFQNEDAKIKALLTTAIKKRFDIIEGLFDRLQTIEVELGKRLKNTGDIPMRELVTCYDIALRAYISVSTSAGTDVERLKTTITATGQHLTMASSSLTKEQREKVRSMAGVILHRIVDEENLPSVVENDLKNFENKLIEFETPDTRERLVQELSIGDEQQVDQVVKRMKQEYKRLTDGMEEVDLGE